MVVLRVAQRRCLGVDLMFLLADIGGAEHAHSLGIGGHDAVLDAVMHHLDEVAGAVWPAVQVTLLGSTTGLFTPRRAWYLVTHAGRQSGQDRIEVLDHRVFTTNHHAVSSLQSPDPTTRPYVHVVDSLRREFLGAPDVIHVVGIAAVDEDVVAFKMGEEISDSVVHDGRRNHQPHRPRLTEFLHKVRERGGANGLFFDQLLHCFRRHVEDHALMTSREQPPHHVRAHPSKTNHSDLHS